MNRDGITIAAALLFALVAALLYRGALHGPPAPPSAPQTTPRSTPTQRPPPTPSPVTERLPVVPRSTPRSTPRPPPRATPPPLVEATQATLRGEVVVEDGSAPGVCDVFATVKGKRINRRTAADGTFRIEAPAGPTSIYGGRRSGALHTRSEAVTLDTSEGGEWEVTLVIPAGETGGLGIGTKAHALGVRVTRVLPGSPAAELGLKRGDIITEVDGVPVAGWGTTRFIAAMTGAVGTSQNFRVRHADGEEETMEFERRVIGGKRPRGAAIEP